MERRVVVIFCPKLCLHNNNDDEIKTKKRNEIS